MCGCVAFFGLALVISVDKEGGEFILDGKDRTRLLEHSLLFTNSRESTRFGPSRDKT
jgi:hypothetical protein